MYRVNQEPTVRESQHVIETRVVGVTFEDRQAVVSKLVCGEHVLLRREPNNPFDQNAIRVEREDGEQIGYLDRHLASEIAPKFDGDEQCVPVIVTAIVVAVVGGYAEYASFGVRIRFTTPA